MMPGPPGMVHHHTATTKTGCGQERKRHGALAARRGARSSPGSSPASPANAAGRPRPPATGPRWTRAGRRWPPTPGRATSAGGALRTRGSGGGATQCLCRVCWDHPPPCQTNPWHRGKNYRRRNVHTPCRLPALTGWPVPD